MGDESRKKSKLTKSIVGKKFNHLFVEKEYIDNKKHCTYCKCLCDCGKEVNIKKISIKSGRTKSCGCLRKVKHKKYNKYNLNKNYGIGYTSNTNKPFYFDLEDYKKIRKYCWLENGNGYICTNKKTKNNKNLLRQHRYIMNCIDSNIFIDHINHNKMDNRKNNLRKCSQKENNQNLKISKRNKTGIIGVCWDKENNKWLSQIEINSKNKKLGRFVNKEDAIIARLKAEKKYFGKFASQKYLFDKYNI